MCVLVETRNIGLTPSVRAIFCWLIGAASRAYPCVPKSLQARFLQDKSRRATVAGPEAKAGVCMRRRDCPGVSVAAMAVAAQERCAR